MRVGRHQRSADDGSFGHKGFGFGRKMFLAVRNKQKMTKNVGDGKITTFAAAGESDKETPGRNFAEAGEQATTQR